MHKSWPSYDENYVNLPVQFELEILEMVQGIYHSTAVTFQEWFPSLLSHVLWSNQ